MDHIFSTARKTTLTDDTHVRLDPHLRHTQMSQMALLREIIDGYEVTVTLTFDLGS